MKIYICRYIYIITNMICIYVYIIISGHTYICMYLGYRHIFFYYASLHCTLQVCYLPTEVLRLPDIEQVTWYHFPTSICSLYVSELILLRSASLAPRLRAYSVSSRDLSQCLIMVPGAVCGSDHELFIANFRLKLK